MAKSKTPPKREMRDGIEVLVYESGLVKRASNGHYMVPPRGGTFHSSERGRELAARRVEIARERAQAGIDAAVEEHISKGGKVTGPQQWGTGWEFVVKHVTSTLLKSKNLRGQAEAANFLGKASGLTVEDRATEADMGVAIANLFEKFLDRLEPQDVIEGEVK